MTKMGDTPLHVIVNYQKPIRIDFRTLHAIVTCLIEANAHIDFTNRVGKTPLQLAATEVAEIVLKQTANISLVCLAAKAICKHKISYERQVPVTLCKFVQLHGKR